MGRLYAGRQQSVDTASQPVLTPDFRKVPCKVLGVAWYSCGIGNALTYQTDQARGQALVETALVLPVLLLLAVLSLDVGRAFLGSVGVHNLSRIGANYAAANPDDPTWGSTSRYHELMMRDAQGIGCGDSVTITPPDFTPDPPVMGGNATVTVSCTFSLVTPIASDILGGALEVTATSIFPVRGVCVGCDPAPALDSPGEPPEDLCNRAPPLVGLSVGGAQTAWRNAGFTGEVTGVDDGDEGRTVMSATPQEPTDADGCLPHATDVLVTIDALPTESCAEGSAYVPSVLGMVVTDARTTWDDAGFDPVNFLPASVAASDVVRTQLFGPGSEAPDACAPTDETTVTVTTESVSGQPSYCKVPDLHLLTTDEAPAIWTGAGFSGSFSVVSGSTAPFTIRYQSLVAHTHELCTAPITVGPDPTEGT